MELPLLEKLKLLQQNRQDLKIEVLLAFLTSKTDKIKSVIDLEEKVRQDMFKTTPVPKKVTTFSRGMGGGRNDDLQEIEERLKNKNLPEFVREEITK